MEFCRKLWKSVFVHPFSAGQIRLKDGSVTHDGSISGVILLTSGVAILCEILAFGTGEKVEGFVHFNIFFFILDTLSVLSCVICVVLHFVLRNKKQERRRQSTRFCIKLRVLWLFGFACIVYAILNLAFHVDCLNRSLPLRHIGESISYDAISILFFIIQTGFLTLYADLRLNSSVAVYYAMLFLFLTNIAVICRVCASSFAQIQEVKHNKSHVSKDNKTFCQYNSSIYQIVDKTAFLEPVFCEYALLSILFLSEMWPIAYENAENLKLNTLNINSSRCKNDNSETDPLIPRGSDQNHDDSMNRTRKFINISFGTILMIPSFVLYFLHEKFRNDSGLLLAKTAYISIEATIFFLFIIKCFYGIQSQCLPKDGRSTFNVTDILLAVCSVGTIAYYCMKLISITFCHLDETVYSLSIYNIVILVIATYFQTVFILQIKNYVKNTAMTTWSSIEYTCLLLAFENLFTWAFDSFVSSENMFSSVSEMEYYGEDSWIILYTFIFPFVIFYRFLCFVSFYDLYIILSKPF